MNLDELVALVKIVNDHVTDLDMNEMEQLQSEVKELGRTLTTNLF